MFEKNLEIMSGFLSTKSINICKDIKEFESFIKRSVLQAPFMFKYNAFFIDVNEFKDEDLESLLELYLKSSEILKRYGIFPIGIKNCKKASRQFFNEKGILVFIETNPSNLTSQNNEEKTKIIEKIIEKETIVYKEGSVPLIYTGVVRGGQVVFAENRDLIIFGHVKTNAEVVAGHNLIIMGTAEGRIVAGANDDSDATIIIGKYNPSLLSINGNYNTVESNDESFGKTVKIRLENNNFKFEEI